MKNANNKKIFFCSAPPEWEKTPSGDADFVEQMMASLKTGGIDSHWIKGSDTLRYNTGFKENNLYDNSLDINFRTVIGNQTNWKKYYLERKDRKQAVKNIIDYIKQNTPEGQQPVFHLTIRTPDTGYMISPTDLQSFKEKDIETVVTCHEYKLNARSDREEFNRSALTYFKHADKVVFLNESCRKIAIKDTEKEQEDKFVKKEELINKSSTSPIPVTVPVDQKDKQTVEQRLERDPNILVFGAFRRLKGFEEACKAAIVLNYIKNDLWETKLPAFFKNKTLEQYLDIDKKTAQQNKNDLKEELKNTKVIFAGSLHHAFPKVYKAILETLRDYPDSIEVHPNPQTLKYPTEHEKAGQLIGLDNLIDACSKNNKTLLQSIRPQTFISNNDLTKLAKRCKYAHKGDQTGMRDNASGIISTLDQGCITYCSQAFNTDECYLPGGRYEKAIDLDTTTGERMDAGYPQANTLLKSIAKREDDQKKWGTINKDTLESMDRLLQEKFSKEAILERHLKIYQTQRRVTKPATSTAPPPKLAPAAPTPKAEKIGKYTIVKTIKSPHSHSGSKIFKVKGDDGKEYILKQAKPQENRNAAMVSKLLQAIFAEDKTNKTNPHASVTIEGKKRTIHIPKITIETIDGTEYQKQEFLPGLTKEINGKTTHGLASAQGIKDIAKVAAILQFLVLSDNIVKNIQTSSSNSDFSLIDFDQAFKAHDRITSEIGIFHDHKDPNDTKDYSNMTNWESNHMLDLLAVKHGFDKCTKNGKYPNGFIFGPNKNPLIEATNENWRDFFQGTVDGLTRIKSTLSLVDLTKAFDETDKGQRPDLKKTFIARYKNLDNTIKFLQSVLSKHTDIGIDIDSKISDSFQGLTGVQKGEFVDQLLKSIAQSYDQFIAPAKPAPAEPKAKRSIEKKYNHHEWLPVARENLRTRLELEPGETNSHKITQRSDRYQYPIDTSIKMNKEEQEDFELRSKPFSKDSNPIGCGTTNYQSGENYPFCHFRFTHDANRSKEPKKLKVIPEVEYMAHQPIAAACIDYPNFMGKENLPTDEELKKIYKDRTLDTLRAYNDLDVDHLIKCGDGMGVFLTRISGNGPKSINRNNETVRNAQSSYIDGFFEAVKEFYSNPDKPRRLTKITFIDVNDKLLEIFNVKSTEFKAKNPGITLPEIQSERSSERFGTKKFFKQNPNQKLGITIAPHGNKKFLGGALGQGSVLEEQISALSDIASIGNPDLIQM